MERICPLLALASDRHTVVDGPDAGHRCHASGEVAPVDRAHQLQLCLGEGYPRCERFRDHLERFGDPRLTPLAAGGRFVPTRIVVSPEPAWAGLAKGRGRFRPLRLLGAGVALALAGAAGVAAASGSLGPDLMAPFAATSTPPATPQPTAGTPAPTPTATPTPTPRPTASPKPATPAATPSPVPTPTPAPAVQETYTVAAGDTLSRIANRFGTTVEAIMAANGISDPDRIQEGQVLVIP